MIKDKTGKNAQEEKKKFGEELNRLLTLLSWKNLSSVIRDIKLLRKAVTSGGRRIRKNNRNAIHKILVRECFRDEMILHSFFTKWFNEQKEYRDCLKPFFQSEEHDELQKELGCNDTEYAVNDEYFIEFIDILRLSDVQKFLLFSPVRFTSVQKEQLEQLRDNQDEIEGAGQLLGDQEEEIGKDKKVGKISLSKGEWKHHKRELKQCHKTIEKLKNDNTKLRNKEKRHNSKKAELTNKIIVSKHDQSREKEILEAQKEALQKKITELEQEVRKMNSRLTERDDRVRNLEKKEILLKEEKDKYFHQILSRLDEEELIATLNAPDDVLDLLGTVIRPPTTDNNSDQPSLITLSDFWKKLVDKEGLLVRNILDVSVKEVVNIKYFQDWDKRVDDFNDLKCSLSARIYLTDMFHYILRQYFLQKNIM